MALPLQRTKEELANCLSRDWGGFGGVGAARSAARWKRREAPPAEAARSAVHRAVSERIHNAMSQKTGGHYTGGHKTLWVDGVSAKPF